MLHRVFIAINLPEDIKNIFVSFQNRYPHLPARWTKKENLHITLIFLGNLDENQLLETINTTKAIVSQYSSFKLKINKLVYGPPKKFPPRLVWAEIEKNQQLSLLQADLERHLCNLSSFQYKKGGNRSYSPHITLARIKTFEFRKIEIEEIPEIYEEMNLSFEVSSIEVMESRLKRGGPEYTILESFSLKK